MGVVITLVARACTTHPDDGVVNELHCTCCNTQLLQVWGGLPDRQGTKQDGKEHLQRRHTALVQLTVLERGDRTGEAVERDGAVLTVSVSPGRAKPPAMRNAPNLGKDSI